MESVKFEATLEDHVDVALRALRISKAAQQMRVRDITMTVGASAIGAFAVVLMLSKGDLGQAAFTAAVTLALMLIGYPRFHDWLVARRTHHLVRESFESLERVPIEVDLDESGVMVRTPDESVRLKWDHITTINDTPDGIEFSGDRGIVMVRSRAFEDAGARARFLEAARTFAGRSASTPVRNGADDLNSS